MREGREPDDSASSEDAEFALETSPLDAPPDAPGAESGAMLGGPTRPRGPRLVALGLTALLVVVVGVGLFVRATSDPAGAVATLLGLTAPTPDATFVPGANTIYLSDGAPWGVLTIDGNRLPSAALTGSPVRVARGTHHLVYQARYFPSLRCVFSAPRAKSDTCPLDASQSTLQFLLDQGLARVIDLGSTGFTLQSGQRAALIQQADSILAAQTATATIAPGDRYLDAHGRLATATAPLHFTLTLALGGSEQAGVGSYCYQFCPDPSFEAGGQPSLAQWPTRVTLAAQWAITDASGKRITPLTYLAGQPYPGSAPIDVGIALTSTGWTITGLERQNAGVTMNAALAVMGNAANVAGGGDYEAAILVTRDPLVGCVMHVIFNSHHVNLFWRYGALVALDRASQHIFSQLPLADASELAAARAMEGAPQHPA